MHNRSGNVSIKNDLSYLSFYGQSHPFSNFYSHTVVYRALKLDVQGNPISPEEEMLLSFKTGEALYQWLKARSQPVQNMCHQIPGNSSSPPDGDVCQAIRNADSPRLAKLLGRTTVKCNADTWSLPRRIAVMREIVALKFSPIAIDEPGMPNDWMPANTYRFPGKTTVSPSIQLLCSGNVPLIEMSPYDRIWGVGMNANTFASFVAINASSAGQTEMEFINAKYSDPIPDDIAEPIKIKGANNIVLGLNILGRILTERRTELRESYMATMMTAHEARERSEDNRPPLKRSRIDLEYI